LGVRTDEYQLSVGWVQVRVQVDGKSRHLSAAMIHAKELGNSSLMQDMKDRAWQQEKILIKVYCQV